MLSKATKYALENIGDRDLCRVASNGLMEALDRSSMYSEPITLDHSAAASVWGEIVSLRLKLHELQKSKKGA